MTHSLILSTTEALSDSQPWWINAALGSLGALVLAIVGNVVQWRTGRKDKEGWDKERIRWAKAVKDETDRANSYGERVLTLMTKAEIHLESNPKALSDLQSTVTGEHSLTRIQIDKGFESLKKAE